MGNKVCKKCGINYDYYLSKGYINYNRPSCRKCYEHEKKDCGNYYHDWKINWGFKK